MGYGDHWGSRGLTRGFVGGVRVEREEKGPGLKPLDSKRLIQGAEAPCSLRRSKGKGARFVGERGGGLRRARVRRGSFDKLRTGSSTAFGASAPDSAQDDGQ